MWGIQRALYLEKYLKRQKAEQATLAQPFTVIKKYGLANKA